MAILNLKPEVGEELAFGATKLLDEDFLDTVKACYDVAEAMGDNPVAQQLCERFKALQDKYNADGVPGAEKWLAGLQEYTDAAEHLKKIQGDTTVKGQVEGEIKTGGFSAVTEL